MAFTRLGAGGGDDDAAELKLKQERNLNLTGSFYSH